ncbi:hypothetical protein GPJ56_010375 [Histomonas meleagridis]|uniref:uncharacterized protein n=1 Tax=Histomonas meleagridis TaxID=135588 RepID=UPI00355A409C|nr:hypothetical protein GPJ56_010375 [Histomonas meleagridis]KAH0806614.1 hypothetical protein GO595_000601 [Histomonas meleagridis]
MSVCCSCRKEVELFELRKDVKKCAQCLCDQVGRSIMDLFKKGLKLIPAPVHVLVAVSGGPSSLVLWDLLSKRLNTTHIGKSAVVRKLSAISTQPLNIPNLIEIPHFSIPDIVSYAKENDYNCVVFGFNVDHISLSNLAAVSCGRPDLSPWLSNDDSENYRPVVVLKPVRKCLESELKFYCDQNKISYDDTPSALYKAFPFENKLLQRIKEEGHNDTSFAVQRMGERLQTMKQSYKCPTCGLPSNIEGPCQMCLKLSD